jgi:hypothetical protein
MAAEVHPRAGSQALSAAGDGGSAASTRPSGSRRLSTCPREDRPWEEAVQDVAYDATVLVTANDAVLQAISRFS